MNQMQELRNLAYTYQRDGKYCEAITLLEGVIALGSMEQYDFQALGALYLETGKPKQSLKYLEKTLNTASHLNRAKAYLALGRIEEGLKLSRHLVSLGHPRVSQIAEALIMAYEEPSQCRAPYPLPAHGRVEGKAPSRKSAPSQAKVRRQLKDADKAGGNVPAFQSPYLQVSREERPDSPIKQQPNGLPNRGGRRVA